MHIKHYLATFLLIGITSLANATPVEFEIMIKDHVFIPAELVVPADVKVKLKIINNDTTPEEFESHKLNREKIIPGNSSAYVFIGPLQAGEYDFVGEFNEDTAKGKIIVK